MPALSGSVDDHKRSVIRRRQSAARFSALAVLLTFLAAAPPRAMQTAALTVVSAGPNGEIRELDDANEIRVIFSEPMVPLGRIPSNPTPSWIHIQPAIKGTYRWSGTTILIFTPDPATPLPHAMRYTVTIDAAAASDGGHRLGTPFTFNFTTPTVRLLSARWGRKADRASDPVQLAVSFNQRVRPEDVVAHLTVRYAPHTWDAPELSTEERARMAAADPAGLQRFDAKVADARRNASRTDAVPVTVATDWDHKRFAPIRYPTAEGTVPPDDGLVVLETMIVPPPGTWLQLSLDTNMPSPEGPARPPQVQRSTAELDPAFFARSFSCRTSCDPSVWNPVLFTVDVDTAAFARAVGVRDATDAAREAAVAPASAVRATPRDRGAAHAIEDAGFDRQPPAHTWVYRLDPLLQSSDGQTLGYPWVGVVHNWHETAFASFGDGHGVWETDGGPQLPFSSRNLTTISQWLTPLTPSALMPRILALEKGRFTDRPPGPGTERRLPVTADAIQAHGLDLTTVLSPRGTGLAWAAVQPGAPIADSKLASADVHSTIIQVTNLGITVKDSPQSTLVFVTRLDNGNPVPAAQVAVINTDNKEVWHGTTNADGVAMAPALPLRDPEDWDKLSFLVTAEKDGDIAYVDSDWNEGIEPWEFDTPYGLWESRDVLRGSVFTDRGVYRPGEEIHVKAIVRADTASGGIRLLPASSKLDIVVRDSRNAEVDRRTVTVNRWSTAEWTWTIPTAATLGNYSIQTMMPGSERPPGNDVTPRRPQGEWLRQVNGSFLVAAYRRPDFRVDATVKADTPVAGATIHAALTARYLFGSVMGKQPVKWSVQRTADFTLPHAVTDRYSPDVYSFGYYPRQAERPDNRVAGEAVTLDAQGALAVDLPTSHDVDYAQRYTFEGDVEDVSRQHIANRADIVLYSAPWHIGLKRPPFFIDTATGTSVDVVAVGHDGQPAAGVAVALSLVRIQWNSVRHAEGSGFYSWDTERVEVPAGQWQVTSAATPVTLRIPLTEGGYYELHATAKDADGHSTRTDVEFYGLGKGYTAWERYDNNRITLTPERKTWKPGETARVMIQSPWETATGLLTIEREGVRRYQRFALTSTQQTVEVPVSEADIPNVFVSVLLIRGRTSKDAGVDGSDPGKPAFRLGYAELQVDDVSKRLTVRVSADRAEYRPTTAAKVAVTVTDVGGKPSAGEVTLWAVDYGVLSLTNYGLPDVLHAIYQEKSLQVSNEDSRQRIVSRRVLTPKGSNDGGGGGNESGAGAMRRDFRPLAFWLGSVETDGGGHATKDVTLPDSLTTYRIMAVAGDSASRFGSASSEIRVTKPVTLLAAFPRFMGLGDRASFGAVVTDTETTGGDAVVTIRSLDPAVLQFQGSLTQTVRLDGGSTAPVRFDSTALATGTARVQMTVRLGANTDSFETTLPVSAVARLETNAAFGDTDAKTTERLALPPGIVPNLGGLEVNLSSTALVGLGEGARYLVDYPYGCAEQKASSALALSLAADLGSAFAMGRISPAEYTAKATSLIGELPRFQCADGGFGYWPGGCLVGDAYLTSYVLHVLKTTSGLGIKSDDAVIGRALDFLDQQMKSPPPQQVQWLPYWNAAVSFGVKVLVEYGRNEDSNITRLLSTTDQMPAFALSYLADAMAAGNRRSPQYPDVIRRLSNALRVEGEQAHVEEIDSDVLRFLWNSNVRSTALVLNGFVARGDDETTSARLVRWLLAARRNGRWGNTQENASALEALVAYYKKYEATTPNMTATVSLGTAPIGTATFRGRSAAAQSVRLAMSDLLRQTAAAAAQDLTVSRAGQGRVYYSTRLQFAPIQPPPPSDQGIHVERRYEPYVENGTSPAATSFNAGDLIRVTLTVTLPAERRYVAVTDPLPAGVEAVDSWFATTASDLARDSSSQGSNDNWLARFRRGTFDHIEKYDDRVVLFATRLADGRHEFSYIVRATTGGTFQAAGTWAEEMYAPEINGRAAPVTLTIR